MRRNLIRDFSLILSMACLAAPAMAQSSFGVSYGSEECNNEPAYLTANDITCATVFASTNVWDFLDNLPRRITLEELNELNPVLGEPTYDSVINGITFVRFR